MRMRREKGKMMNGHRRGINLGEEVMESIGEIPANS